MSTTHPPRSEKPSRMSQVVGSAQDTLLSLPGLDYLMIRILVLFLTGIGVVMAFSTSMTWSVAEGATVWSTALRQCLMVAIGLMLFWVALKVPMRVVRSLAPWLLGLTLILLIAVLIPGIGTGREEVGSQSWIPIGPVQLQPSEIAKVAIAVWGANHLAGHRHDLTTIKSPFVQYVLVAGAFFLLIIAQGDVGMALSFAAVVAFTLIFAGIKWGIVASFAVVALLGMIGLFLSGGFRSQRFHTYFDALTGNFENTQNEAFQTYQGYLSLADGSLGGVGLGQSRAKWFYLPEAKNDFVFAVIGEELGLWGGALVIILFALLGFFGLRTAVRASNQFQGLMAAALTMGVVSQAFVNIGYVVGALPVTGIQLPMISAGGTSAVITIGSMGLLASVARHEPEAVSAMQSYGRPMFDRLFFIGEPNEDGGAKGERGRGLGGNAKPRAVPVTARRSSSLRPGGEDVSSTGSGIVGQRPSRRSGHTRSSQRIRPSEPGSPDTFYRRR
ncbi:FtsW/RodA/SpoVE family cell cycle protein [Corynebacterium tapiri]|uniref:Probable peptidoglycan glycosyltransferase FtsW n=1 Tax=Corynebacterium tapiri TaxID=1448266 RepID=A0A5C4U5D7_9CORY|nr:putative peptidoglycan glycosyltransferase FtsW [Corynebacterium tapiri]TNL99399.1 cell division protein FtsW [Corynebacterium tapiri]